MKNELEQYYNTVAKYPVLSADEESQLIIRYKQRRDSVARDKLIMSMERLVISVAKKYQHYNFSLMDTIQDGNLGLLYALEKFDETKGIRFSTYAMFWIKHYIIKGTYDIASIKIPEKIHIYNKEIIETKNKIEQERLHQISAQKLSEILDIPVKEVEQAISSQPVVLVDIEELNSIADRADESGNPETNFTTSELHEAILNILEDFQDIERNIIIQRYGLDDNLPKSEQELSELYQLSIAQIKKIETKAVRKMKHPKIKKVLKQYL